MYKVGGIYLSFADSGANVEFIGVEYEAWEAYEGDSA